MKTFFMKVFLIVASALCLFEGLVLAAVGLGQLSPERLFSFYSRLLAAPKSLATISGIGMFFVILGFILLLVSSRTKPAPKMITVEKDGKALHIPQETIKSFIRQILEQNPYASDISVDFESKEDWINISISSSLDAVGSVHREVDQIEEVLRREIESVFEWRDFKFTFQLRGLGIDPRKKYFASADVPIQPADAGEQDAGEAEIMLEDEAPPAKNTAKGRGKLKNKTLLSKMLWGK
jgi:hypothetical protein